jgi:hypothetical protein
MPISITQEARVTYDEATRAIRSWFDTYAEPLEKAPFDPMDLLPHRPVAAQADGAEIQTVEGLAENGELGAIQRVPRLRPERARHHERRQLLHRGRSPRRNGADDSYYLIASKQIAMGEGGVPDAALHGWR